jgi:hypothetical protein
MTRNSLITVVPALLVVGACTTIVATPEALHPGANTSLAMVVPAKGVQIYECRAKKTADGFEWAFVAPDANLYDARGRTLGHHGAGPYWQAADGSRVTATVKARADAPTAGNIPWLLLAAADNGNAGSFRGVTHIQRVNTVGGIAPAEGCDAAATGKRARVDYAADYLFFVSSRPTTQAQR